jgi:hypothetical protein
MSARLAWLFQMCRRSMRQLSHGPDETVTSPGNRFNVRWVLSQGLSKDKDVVG